MSIAVPPSGRLLLATDYAHSPSLLEDFVEDNILHFDSIVVPVKVGSILRNRPDYPPMAVPSDVVAILIRQPEIPATFSLEDSSTGYVVTESEPSKPEEFYVLLTDPTDGRSCTIEGTVEVRYIYPRDPVAEATFFASYFS